MEKNQVKLQVLLVIETSFCTRQICPLKPSITKLPGIEKLKEACWNGWFHAVFPELFGQHLPPKLFIAGIADGNSTIEVRLGNGVEIIDEEKSIFPEAFLKQSIFN